MKSTLNTSRDAETAGALLVRPKFGGVALVCGDCQKRSNGPSKLKAKDVRKLLKKELHNQPVRLRIVQCSCLGICPRKALAVSAVAAGQVLAAELRSEDEARAAAAAFARALS
ncbi:hypothetical protein QTH90_08085 [Variovorax sp. J2P1-59]|uniref:hypothetical protein n=1 Tax=Variovorax flavidus TaxID=3053501 RepID=UPI002577CBC3|nr:hypothetical protein [Variovorax sp. J2P1-59]MDM0074335.1 hypothetical protein [Variovorax sp. J2P1-59]